MIRFQNSGQDQNIIYIIFPTDNTMMTINFYNSDTTDKTPSQILSSFRFLTSDEEKAKIDNWIDRNNLNQYGDSKDRQYLGGTPLFNEVSGERVDRYDYIIERHPDRPWNLP
jgi:hypothetical protein